MTNIFRYFALIFIALGALALSCRTPMPSQPGTPPGHSALTLKATAVSTRWVILQWNNDSSAVSHSYVLLRNGKDTVYNGTFLKTVDSVNVKDSALTPSLTYNYSLYRIYQNQHWDSATCAVTMLDTSRDNYNYTITNIPGTVYCVWSAGNPNSVWLGGGGTVDSGSNRISWGAVHYTNGQFQFLSAVLANVHGISGISDSNIWFANGGLAFWNGSQCVDYPFTGIDPTLPNIYPKAINAVWCAPDGEVWGGGDSGVVIHRKQDSLWEVQQAPTDLQLTSMVGFSPNEIYAAGSNLSCTGCGGVLCEYNGTVWSVILQSQNPDSAMSVYNMNVAGSSGDSLYVVGNGVFHRTATGWQNRTPKQESYYAENACAQTWNNVWVCGDYGMLLHFDGDHWTEVGGAKWPYDASEILWDVYTVGNQVFAVGEDLTNYNLVFINGQ